MKDKLKKLIQQTDSKGRSKKTNYLIIIGLIGILLIIISNTFQSISKQEEQNEQLQIIEEETESEDIQTASSITEVGDLEVNYENELREMLTNIEGVSEVEVMVNLDSTNVKVYEKNLILGQQTTDESDQNGGIRKVEDHTKESQVVLIRQGDQEVPILIQTKKPEVRGVFIVAKGADHPTTKQWIVESTSRVLDVPTHRVSVMPKN